MIDIQKEIPKIPISIPRVGISNLKLPVSISTKEGGFQHTVADISVFVDVKDDSRGSHMSRLAIGVHKFTDMPLNTDMLINIAEYIKGKIDSTLCEVVYTFPYFIKKTAPISKEPGIVHSIVTFRLLYHSATDFLFRIKVVNTTTSLCPCSKEISDGGAHCQRSKISIECTPKDVKKIIWIEDVVDLANKHSACEIYSVLKRVDEKHVTEYAYNNPCFVEDAVRSIYNELLSWPCIQFTVDVINEESIHQHEAVAKMTYNSKSKEDNVK